jgi:hypothetical protein
MRGILMLSNAREYREERNHIAQLMLPPDERFRNRIPWWIKRRYLLRKESGVNSSDYEDCFSLPSLVSPLIHNPISKTSIEDGYYEISHL